MTDTRQVQEAQACADEVRRIKFAFDRGDDRRLALERLAKRIESFVASPPPSAGTPRTLTTDEGDEAK